MSETGATDTTTAFIARCAKIGTAPIFRFTFYKFSDISTCGAHVKDIDRAGLVWHRNAKDV